MGLTPAHLREFVTHIRARQNSTGTRQIIGLAGAPGTGKSTLARGLGDARGRERSIVVPMDGFHLANEVIEGTPLRDRKGAIDTFDAAGYVTLIGRLRARDEPTVYAPSYRRGLEEPIAAAIAVPRAVDFVITEGNYLLSAESPWHRIRSLVDEIWFVDIPQPLRIERLIQRHISFGMTREAATSWATGPDELNARYIELTRYRADRQIHGD